MNKKNVYILDDRAILQRQQPQQQSKTKENNGNLTAIMQKLDDALESIERNELKMKELEQDNLMLQIIYI